VDRIDFQGRVVIVTGAGGGLGAEYCRLLAARGAAVVVNDLGGSTTGEGGSREFADKVVDEIRSAGGKAVSNYDTVATPQGGEAIVRAAVEQFGRIDAVVNNAGNQRNVRFGELTEQDLDAVYAVHVKGAFFVTQPAYRLMAKQGYGRIVLVSSQSGIFGNPIRANYGSAKTAMIGLMNVIAQEAPSGIAVNCIFPNAMGGRLGGKPGDVRPDAEFLAAAGQRVRHYIDGMQPSFVAPLVAWLASERCTSSQNMYSVLGGKYSRIFVGLTRGWYRPGKTAPTPEDIAAHLAEIDDRAHFDVPRSGLEEMDAAVAAVERHQQAQRAGANP
jgi:NAD(P)-dependent dehydrogenase (short-subunit alcohol dehydrogenase family)